MQLAGLEAPRTTTVKYPEIPAGVYEVHTILLGPGGKTRTTASQQVEILPRFSR